MAVFTPLSQSDIAEFITRYEIGALADAQGITEGVENTNYLIEISPPPEGGGDTRYILTLFERRSKLEDLPYFAALMEWLAARGIPCPLPIKKTDGGVFSALKEKPAMLVSFLEGTGVSAIRQEHLPQIGKLAAEMHLAGMEFPHRRANALSVAGWEALAAKIDGRADTIEPGLDALIEDELRYLRECWPSGLPGGPIHADLFPDNVFFQRERGGARLSGVIDFYFACHDAWAYDLAICVNAWCFDGRHRFVPERAQALIGAYNDIRPMSDEETTAMPILLRGAALRFLLTRTLDWLDTPPSAQIVKKDPLEYARKLEFFRSSRS